MAFRKIATPLFVGVGVFVVSPSAYALDDDAPPSQTPPPADSPALGSAQGAAAASPAVFEFGARGGYVTPPIRGGTTPFGAGFGGRLGFNAGNVYLGISIVRYLGGTDVTLSNYAFVYGAELGYSFPIARVLSGSLILRPHVGGGAASIFHVDPSTTSSSGTSATSRTRNQSLPVDVVTQASSSATTGTTSSRSSSTVSNTTTVNGAYVDPGVSFLFASGPTYAGITAHSLILPSLSYGGAEATTWLSYGLEGQIGLRF